MLLLIRHLVNKFSSLICYLDLATSVSGKTVDRNLMAVLSGRAVASGHLEDGQKTVIIYLFFRGVSGKGPIKLTPMVCHTSHFTGVKTSSNVTKCAIQYIYRHTYNQCACAIMN